jgi:hypothetical protein
VNMVNGMRSTRCQLLKLCWFEKREKQKKKTVKKKKTKKIPTSSRALMLDLLPIFQQYLHCIVLQQRQHGIATPASSPICMPTLLQPLERFRWAQLPLPIWQLPAPPSSLSGCFHTGAWCFGNEEEHVFLCRCVSLSNASVVPVA